MQTSVEKQFSATQEALTDILGWVEEVSSSMLSFEKALNIQLAIEEAVVNVVSYAYKESKVEPIIIIKFTEGDTEVAIDIEDMGAPFNQLELTAYDYEADVENRQIGGLGRPFIISFTDKQAYNFQNGHNILSFTINK